MTLLIHNKFSCYIIINMKAFFLMVIFSSFQIFPSYADVKLSDYKNYTITKTSFQLEEISKGLNHHWGLTFIDDENLLITEKSGRLLKINISTGEQFNIVHDLSVLASGQGGLLDVLYHNGFVYFSYSHNHGNRYSSTSIARGKLIDDSIKDLKI